MVRKPREVFVQVSITQLRANFSSIAKQADAGVDLVITSRGKPAYRLLPIGAEVKRKPFPDVTALAMQSRPSTLSARSALVSLDRATDHGCFVTVWRTQNERF